MQAAAACIASPAIIVPAITASGVPVRHRRDHRGRTARADGALRRREGAGEVVGSHILQEGIVIYLDDRGGAAGADAFDFGDREAPIARRGPGLDAEASFEIANE